MKVLPYLCFEGRTEEAIEFYKAALGAEVLFMMRGSDAPPQEPGEGCAGGEFKPEAILHAELKIGESTIQMSDGMNSGNAEFKGITLSVAVPTDAECEKAFNAISEGGQVYVPLAQTFFASKWGMCVDKFGVSWMVLSPAPVPA